MMSCARENVMPRTGIDELDRLAGVQHGLDFLYCDAGQIAKLFLHQWTRWLDFRCVS